MVMYYAPHILERRVSLGDARDEFGRLVKGGYSWEYVCKCRCDENTDQVFETENGKTYRPKHHVVCEGRIEIKSGDYVRCMDGEEIRGEGEVFNKKRLNYLEYSEIWM